MGFHPPPIACSVLMVGILGQSSTSMAQECDPANYETSTEPDLIYQGRPTTRLPTPSVQGVRDRWQHQDLDDLANCDADEQTSAVWCKNSLAYVPSASGHSPAGYEPLFLFLHGAGNYPEQHQHILNTAAFVGYRTVGLSWDAWSFSDVPTGFKTASTRFRQCASFIDHDDDDGATTPDQLYEFPVCGDPCQYEMATEMITGVEVDDAISPYDAHPMRSITHRLALVLNDLHLTDLGDGSNDYHWGDFCEVAGGQTRVSWENVVVGGFSMGGSMAGFISYTEGTEGLLLIEGGSDVCRDPADVGNQLAVLLDEHYDVPCQGSCDNSIGGWNINGGPGAGVALRPDLLAPLGLYPKGNDDLWDIDCLFQPGGCPPPLQALDFDTAPSNMFSTTQEPVVAGNEHASMAVDFEMPDTFLNGAAKSPPAETDDVYLFPVYVEALCDLF